MTDKPELKPFCSLCGDPVHCISCEGRAPRFTPEEREAMESLVKAVGQWESWRQTHGDALATLRKMIEEDK